MLDKAGHHERWGIVKEGGKGRREKETLHCILWVDIIKRNEQTSLYFTCSHTSPFYALLRLILHSMIFIFCSIWLVYFLSRDCFCIQYNRTCFPPTHSTNFQTKGLRSNAEVLLVFLR